MRSVVFLVCVAFLLAGCGSKSGDDAFTTPEKNEDGSFEIHLEEDRTFDPAKAKVPKGAIVRFHAHLDGCDVTSDEANGPSSSRDKRPTGNGIMSKGMSYNWIADTPGDYHISCTKHKAGGMKMVLRVLE